MKDVRRLHARAKGETMGLTTLSMEGLAADNRQLGGPELGSILASGLLCHSADGQRCLLQLKPDPLGGVISR